jgi:hypothetical protein
MHNAQTAASVADNRQLTPVAGPTGRPGERPAWSTPLLTPLLVGGTRAGGPGPSDGALSAMVTGSGG